MRNLLTALIFTFAGSLVANACEKISISPLTIQMCKTRSAVDFHLAYSDGSQLQAQLSGQSQLNSLKVLNRDRIFSEDLRADTLAALKSHGNLLDSRYPELKRLLEMTVDMLPTDEPVPDFSVDALELFQRARFAGFQTICELIGQSTLARYTSFGETYEKSLFVGMEDTACRGRCGTNCYQPFQSAKRQYTRECLNHEIGRAHV